MNVQYRFISTVQGLLAISFLMFGLWSSAIAHDGHSHDKETKPPIVVNTFPTLTAVSENYELVGIVQSGQMTVFLDRFESNAPVVDAELEFDIAGTVVKAVRSISIELIHYLDSIDANWLTPRHSVDLVADSTQSFSFNPNQRQNFCCYAEVS